MSVPTQLEVSRAVERSCGSPVTSIRRQLRWRPTWFVDVERDGELVAMVVRGDRVDTEILPLRHEYTFHRLLEERHFKVPHLFGFMDEIGAVLMERVPGRPDFDGADSTTRDAIVDEYLQELARLHSIDPQPFIEAGIMHPAPGQDAGMVTYDNLERRFRARKTLPDPFMEFSLGWMHRHRPLANGRLAPTVWDTGQFHHEDGRLIAILDLEFGHVGDPLSDIATWRMRDTLIPFGDMRRLYARYEELTGEPVDLETVKRHHFGGCLSNQLIFGPAVAAPEPDSDLMNSMQWNSETNLMATEFLGEYMDIELPAVDPIESRNTRHDRTFDHLVASLRSTPVVDPETQHRLRMAFRMARHLQRRSEIGDALDEADIDDVHHLTGHRPAGWFDAERRLEQFVLADAVTGRYDEQLTVLFHRRNLRTHQCLGPPGSSMVRHYQCQRFDGTAARMIQL